MGPFGWIYIALIGWTLTELALLSWRRPERMTSGWSWSWPAPTRELHWIGPEPPSPPTVAVAGPGWVRWTSGEVKWLVVDPVHVGATEDWSPRHAAAEAEAGMLPLDDVDEWLAGRLKAYEHELSRISSRKLWLIKSVDPITLDEELERFRQGSMALHEYRSMILDSTGGYTAREAMQLEAMLAA